MLAKPIDLFATRYGTTSCRCGRGEEGRRANKVGGLRSEEGTNGRLYPRSIFNIISKEGKVLTRSKDFVN